jgi:hypothetical protein
VAALENAALALDFVFCVQARRCVVFSFCQLLGPLEMERPPGPALLSHVPPSNGPRNTVSDLVIAEALARQVRKDAHDMAGRHRIFARASRRSGITGSDFQYMTILGRFGDRKGGQSGVHSLLSSPSGSCIRRVPAASPRIVLPSLSWYGATVLLSIART